MYDIRDVEEFLEAHESQLPSYLLEDTNGPLYLQERSYDADERERFVTVLEQASNEDSVDVSLTRETRPEHGEPAEKYEDHTNIAHLVYEDHDETKRWDALDQPPRTVIQLSVEEAQYELRYEDRRRCQDWGQSSRKLFMEDPSARGFLSALEDDFPATVMYSQHPSSR